MKNDKNLPKTAKIGAILYAFNALRMKNIVKTQKDFADLLGINEHTLSAALRGKDRYVTDSLLSKIEEYMQNNHGINIYDQQGALNLAGASSVVVEGDQKILGGDNEKWFTLVSEKDKQMTEKDRQIDRLLALLEREQESREELIKKLQ